MKNNKVTNFDEFRHWVKVRLAEEGITMNELAKQMGVSRPRISEATLGNKYGRKYIVPIIEHLDGDLKDFKEFLKAV